MTKLTSALPKGDANGLIALAHALTANPSDVHAVIALVDCRSTDINHDTGEVIPTARIRRIEVVDGPDLDLAEKVMRRALEKRTGQTVLDFDLEEQLRAAFGNIDPATGEILGHGTAGASSADDDNDAG